MKREDYICVCRKYCNKYDTSYHVDFMYNINAEMKEEPQDKREVCKNCIYNDSEFLTGCNFPYIVD